MVKVDNLFHIFMYKNNKPRKCDLLFWLYETLYIKSGVAHGDYMGERNVRIFLIEEGRLIPSL